MWLTAARNVAHLHNGSAVAMLSGCLWQTDSLWTVYFLFLLQVVVCLLLNSGEKVEGGLAFTCIDVKTKDGVTGSLKAVQSCGEFNAHVFAGSV